ncbi:putative phosphatidylinositol transfer protein sfh5 [Amylocarpus encephaloides]|uniref:Phosphatidylinositol transfer protein SFH5 n=1 Tax=Amylocarpus encephaloides TaxID=45428 RepID=A0A9P7YNN3_9HELO|nr:putative phosphatidylinositol transfer protein sfh5 [Amylocarpus encephaloides]
MSSETAPLVEAPKEVPKEASKEERPESAAKTTAEEAAVTQATPEVKKEEPAPEPPQENKAVAFTERGETPLENILAELPSIIKDVGHGEMWGVELSDGDHVPTTIVIEKFLKANNGNVTEAIVQLKKALKWRKEMNPAGLLANVEFDRSKFGDLGYVTVYPQTDGAVREIVTWNIYGAVKDLKSTFGNLEDFIKWRAALMELAVRELNLASATVKIPQDGVDPYRMIQVHDYLNVSFLRMDPAVKAASKETIQIFSMAYPELLKEKFFVNVPILMGWVFAAMKLFLSAETIKKFHPLSYGGSLAGELPALGDDLPTDYGGKGKDIQTGLTVQYTAEEAVKAE